MLFKLSGFLIEIALPIGRRRTLSAKVCSVNGVQDLQSYLSLEQRPHSGSALTEWLAVFCV
jgi:hypothetical protein